MRPRRQRPSPGTRKPRRARGISRGQPRTASALAITSRSGRVVAAVPRTRWAEGRAGRSPLFRPVEDTELRKAPAGLGWAGLALPGPGEAQPGKLKSRKQEIKSDAPSAESESEGGQGAHRVCVGPSVRVSACVCVSAARAGALTISPGERGHFGVGLEMLRLRLLPPRHAGSNISWGRIKNY